MSDLRLNNSIFLMYLATEEYKSEHDITSMQFLELDEKYDILIYIADCPEIFDSMTKQEMAREIDEYIGANQ